MSTLTDANRVTLSIAGHTHGDWLRYTIDSDFFTPADGWQLSLGVHGNLPDYVVPWAEVQIRVGEDLVMTGRIDQIIQRYDKDRHVVDITGRDGAAVLLDCSAPVFVAREITLAEAVATVVRPFGITGLEIAERDAAFVKTTVEPGMSAWEVIQQAAEASGLWAWFAPDGTLRVAAPDYTTPPVADLIMYGDDPTRNNVLELSAREDMARRWSEVTVLAQGAGTESSGGKASMRGTATDDSVTWYRPLIIREGCLDNPGDALKKAKKRLADGIMDSLTITAKVRGHRTSDGILWEPGQRVTLNSGTVYFLTRRTFSGGRDGITTTLTLKPDGVWLPDTSAKRRRGRKSRKQILINGEWDY